MSQKHKFKLVKFTIEELLKRGCIIICVALFLRSHPDGFCAELNYPRGSANVRFSCEFTGENYFEEI